MAGTMHKMAVYLGLVEDDPRYDDGYDSYEEYEDENGEQAEPAEPEADRPVPRARSEFVMDPAPPARMCPDRSMPPISPGSPPCTRARTMKLVLSESTFVRALR
jgi:cell division inhibitor SepF